MGFFPGMVKTNSNGAYQTYALHISGIGECVIQHLDAAGEAKDFVVAQDAHEMLTDLALELSPNAMVFLFEEDEDLVMNLFEDCHTWADVCAVLNKHQGTDWAVARAVYNLMYRPSARYIQRDYKTNTYSRTADGERYDAKYHPQPAPVPPGSAE